MTPTHLSFPTRAVRRVRAFLRHAWGTPFTTFTVLAAVCAFLGGDLSDGKPFSVLKALKILAGFFAVLAGMAMPECAAEPRRRVGP